ncbi:MAG: hypoxanthine phosphoribosyltransferase [Chloroflexi bacterium]|nr:hypoxanthine phosphoribosyltransferase [Chloroflexota bacterium]
MTDTLAHPDIEQVLISSDAVQARVDELGALITGAYAGRAPILIGVLKGAVVFMTDLVRAIHLPVELDFMAVSSYGNSTETSGIVRITKDLDATIEGRDVLLVEDIVDSGMTLKYLRQYLERRDPASLRICTLLDKQVVRKADVTVEYTGFQIPDRFVVGYGLDYAERYRNLPYIGILKKSVYGG